MPSPTRSRRIQSRQAAAMEADRSESEGGESGAQLEYAYVTMGVDPGTGTTGYGVVGLTHAGGYDLLACGVIRTPPRTPMHLRLQELFNDLRALIDEFRPQALAVEKLFFGRNVTTA